MGRPQTLRTDTTIHALVKLVGEVLQRTRSRFMFIGADVQIGDTFRNPRFTTDDATLQRFDYTRQSDVESEGIQRYLLHQR